MPEDEELNARRDKLGEEISTAGAQWSSKVLRKEDMQLYIFRLLLEFARVKDDNRDILMC